MVEYTLYQVVVVASGGFIFLIGNAFIQEAYKHGLAGPAQGLSSSQIFLFLILEVIIFGVSPSLQELLGFSLGILAVLVMIFGDKICKNKKESVKES